jgi:protein-S-isoprenylcysteine O-methyltransferase Ste14
MSPPIAGERGARVSFPPPLVFLAAILLGAATPHFGVWTPPPIERTIRIMCGIAALVTGVGLIASARILFLRTGQSPVPWSPTPELILKGPYRFTRNPMYIGATLIVLGLGFALDNLWISVLAFPALLAVHFIAVLPEERYLREKFGNGYDKYRVSVRRYL